jgi:hypothetical protein
LERGPNPDLTDVFVDKRYIAEIAAAGEFGFRARSAGADALFGIGRQVMSDFVAQIVIALSPSPEAPFHPLGSFCRAHDPRNGFHHELPLGFLSHELPLSGRGQFVIFCAPVEVGTFPFRGNEATRFQAMKGGIKRAAFNPQQFRRTLADGEADSMPVPRSPLESAQDEHVEGSLEEINSIFGRWQRHTLYMTF